MVDPEIIKPISKSTMEQSRSAPQTFKTFRFLLLIVPISKSSKIIHKINIKTGQYCLSFYFTVPTILFFETSLEDSHCYHLYWILQYSASVSSDGANHINTIGAVCNFSIGCNYKVLYCIKLQIVSSLKS